MKEKYNFRKNTYKGGTMGKSYEIKKGEEILDCLRSNGFQCTQLERESKLNEILS